MITIALPVAALMLRFMLGRERAGARGASPTLVPTILLNLMLTFPVYALTRRLLRPRRVGRAREVRLLG